MFVRKRSDKIGENIIFLLDSMTYVYITIEIPSKFLEVTRKFRKTAPHTLPSAYHQESFGMSTL